MAATEMGKRRARQHRIERARRGGSGNVPQARVILDKHTWQPKRVQVWRDGRWQDAEFHVQTELAFEAACGTPEGEHAPGDGCLPEMTA